MGKRFAICCGLTRVNPDAYDGWDGWCPGCDRDAAMMATACHDRGFDGVSVFINQAVDHSFVKPAFMAACEAMSEDDLLLLYNSGHGGQQWDTSGDEQDQHDETLCWFNSELLDDVIDEYLQLVPAGGRVAFITDTCNSETNYRGRTRRRRSTPVLIDRLLARKREYSLLHFGGCADGRSSYGTDQGGVFTLAMMDVLRRARRPISWREWFERAAARMDWRQVPVYNEAGPLSFLNREALT